MVVNNMDWAVLESKLRESLELVDASYDTAITAKHAAKIAIDNCQAAKHKISEALIECLEMRRESTKNQPT